MLSSFIMNLYQSSTVKPCLMFTKISDQIMVLLFEAQSVSAI